MDPRICVDRETLISQAEAARMISNPPRQIAPGALVGERTSRQNGRGLNFDSLRQYQPGDDIRLIDWQATARLRSPWIRLFNEERERPVFLIVDQRLDMFFTTRGLMKSVAAAKTAAMLAWRSWLDGDRTGSLVFSDSEFSLQKCNSPRITLNPILDDLLRYNQKLPELYPSEPASGISLAHILHQAGKVIPGGAWVAVLSDFHDLNLECEALLSKLRRRCEISAFIFFDDLHLRLPVSGFLSATYRGQDAAFSLTPPLKEDIERTISARLAFQQNRLANLNIQVNHVVVTRDLIRQLQKGI
ncbi:TPA: DUF58 domain-containing protein [Raoultella planticola]|nr:DUF58 domain-containing protein [Raoultella planticola]